MFGFITPIRSLKASVVVFALGMTAVPFPHWPWQISKSWIIFVIAICLFLCAPAVLRIIETENRTGDHLTMISHLYNSVIIAPFIFGVIMAIAYIISVEMLLVTSREEFDRVLTFIYGMVNLFALWTLTQKGLRLPHDDRYGVPLLGIYLVVIGGIIFITIH